jgi:hypothetical protein
MSAFVLVLGVPFTRAAPLPPPKQPLQLSMSLDRDTYYPGEPIFAELALTNRDPRPVTIPAIAIWDQSVRFEYLDEKGRKFTLGPSSVVCGVFRSTVRLSQFQQLKDWKDLQDEYCLYPYRAWLLEPGTYTMRAFCKSVFSFDGIERSQEFETTSPPVVFKVVQPTGVQKEALDFIRRTISERIDPVTPKDPKDPESVRAAQKETQERFDFRMQSWRHYIGKKWPDVVELTQGERYGAAALLQYDPARCYWSSASSPLVKGLCAFRLFATGGDAGPRREREKERQKWAEVLVKEYPNTIAAMTARYYLDNPPRPDR